MKYRQEISFNSLTATLFHSSCVRKSIFYSKNIQYPYNLYGTELYVNVCRGVFRTHCEHLWWNFFVKITRKVCYRCSAGFSIRLWHKFYSRKVLQNVNIYLIWSKSTSKICHCLLVSRIDKKHVGLTVS